MLILRLAAALLSLNTAIAATFAGRVVEDHSGSPVVSAVIRMWKTGERNLSADIDTDGEGRFEAAELPRGDYRVEITKPNFLKLSLRMHLRADDSVEKLAARLIRCGAISGRVVDREGQPLAGAFVYAVAQPAAGGPIKVEWGTRQSSVDRRGQYRLFNLPPGQYGIVVAYGASAAAVGGTGRSITQAKYGSGFLFYPDNSRPQFLRVAAGDEVKNIDFAISPATFYSVRGTVDVAGPKWWYWFALASVEQPAMAAAVTQSNENGVFAFDGVAPGAYYLFAAGPSTGRSGRGAQLSPGAVSARTRVDIGSQNVEGITAAPQKGITADFVLRAIAGSSPVCAASAQLVLSPVEDWAANLDQQVSVTLGKPSTVSNLAPAKYAITLGKAGEHCYLAGTPVVDLSTPSTGPIAVDVTQAGSVSGRVRAGNRPISDFAVVLAKVDQADLTGVRLEFPDADGAFTFAPVPPGRYRLSVQERYPSDQSRRIAPVAIEVDVPAGPAAAVALEVRSL